MLTFTLSIETDAGAYRHGAHLGTDDTVARAIAEEVFAKRIPKIGTRIVTVALIRGGKMVDCFGGTWLSDDLNAAYEAQV